MPSFHLPNNIYATRELTSQALRFSGDDDPKIFLNAGSFIFNLALTTILMHNVSSPVDVQTGIIIPENLAFIPIGVSVNVQDFVVGSKAQDGIINIGWTASDYDDIISGLTFTPSGDDSVYTEFFDGDVKPIVTEGIEFYVRATQGSDADTENWNVGLLGRVIVKV